MQALELSVPVSLVTARQQLRREALLGNGWPQQYQGRVFYGVGSQAINPRAMK
jgi:hypothetical protein